MGKRLKREWEVGEHEGCNEGLLKPMEAEKGKQLFRNRGRIEIIW
jgi:hypothetical protein